MEYLGAGSNAGDEPASFDSVVSVGGTVLSKGGGKRGWSESVSTDSPGGCATGVEKPAWQHFGSYCEYRIQNDVAAVSSDVAMYDSYDNSGWFTIDGTSISTPFIAGVFGLAGNASKQLGGRTFWQASHQKHLYSPTGGSACVFSQGTYSTCSGWGTPDGVGAF